jgi:hypothetical protein
MSGSDHSRLPSLQYRQTIMIKKFPILILTAATFLLLACEPPAPAVDDSVARGREQLIRAFDAGWIRYLSSGKALQALDSEPPNQPGAAHSYIVRMADCLPQPELAEFPRNPVGLFKQILETGQLRRLIQAVPNTPADTSYYFSGISDKYLRGVLDEIGSHYGVDLQTIDVPAKPGRLASTSFLIDDEVDFVSQLNATGGVTQDMRRRISRRFTCTMNASSQFIHLPESSELAAEINTWSDLVARPDVRICAGPLSTQTVRAFLPKNKVSTIYIGDLAGCVRKIEAGKADIMINPLPDLSIAEIDGYKSVHTMIIAGTPLWVALEGVECPSDDNPKTMDACFETDPL